MKITTSNEKKVLTLAADDDIIVITGQKSMVGSTMVDASGQIDLKGEEKVNIGSFHVSETHFGINLYSGDLANYANVFPSLNAFFTNLFPSKKA